MADEETPLLQEEKTPLDMKQMMIVMIVTFVEPVQFGILFPFIYFMVKDFHVAKDDSELGWYVGWLASSFCIAQLFSSLPWGWLSDRIGRRPVILIGLVGNAITCTLFGLSKSYSFSLLLRTTCGLMNGNIGVIKSVLGEMTDHTNRGLAFMYWESAFGMGSIIGPLLGGLLVNPAENYPQLFGSIQLFKENPYLLPCIFSSFISLVGAFIGAYYMKETSPASKKELIEYESSDTLIPTLAHSASTASITSVMTNPKSIRNIFTKNVCMSVLSYATWCLIQIIYEEVYVLYVATPRSAGGLSYTSQDIALAMSILGVVQIISQLGIYPRIENKWGKVGVFKFSAILMIFFSFALPFVTDITRMAGIRDQYQGYEKVWTFVLLLLVISGRTIACVCGYIPVMIFVNDSAPDGESLGMVHGFGQVAASFARSVGPALGGYLWSWSLSNTMAFPLDFHFVFLLVSALTCFSVYQSCLLTE